MTVRVFLLLTIVVKYIKLIPKRMQQVCRFLLLVSLTSFIFQKSNAQQFPAADSAANAVDTTVQPVTSIDSAAKTVDTTVQPVTSIDADLLNIYNQKAPKRYKIAGIE